MREEPSTAHHRELIVVRKYLENSSMCRRKWLLEHFDPKRMPSQEMTLWCAAMCVLLEVYKNRHKILSLVVLICQKKSLELCFSLVNSPLSVFS